MADGPVLSCNCHGKIKPPLYVSCNFLATKFTLECPMLVDSGADCSLIPVDLFPENLKPYLDKTTFETKGVTPGTTKALGQFQCTVRIGDGRFTNKTIYVVNSTCPPLLGRDILQGANIKNRTVAYNRNGTGHAMTLRFFSKKRQRDSIVKVPLITPPRGAHEFKKSIVWNLPTQRQNNCQAKMEWLKEHGISLSHPKCTKAQIRKFEDLLYKFRDRADNELGTFPFEVDIPTNGESAAQNQYPIPERFKDKVGAEIKDMFDKGIIEYCADTKGFHSPLQIVSKKNGDPRICVNFKRTLNTVLTEQDTYQMPSTDSCFQRIKGGNEFFSSLDLKNGYWQIVLKEGCRHKTAFSWQGRDYQFRRLPFGLTSAAQIFSRAVATALNEVSTLENILVYLDDTMVFADNYDDYYNAHEKLFTALTKFDLKLNLKKCTFLQTQTVFLGRKIDRSGYSLVTEYLDAIRNLPAPTTKKEVASLIGRVVWLKELVGTRLLEKVSVTSFSHLLSELHKLRNDSDKKNVIWTREADAAWEAVKKRLSTAPVISFPNYEEKFTVTCDASDVALGAVLMQEYGGKLHLVASTSHLFSEVERRWSTTEREAYAILYSIQKFDYFLRGRPFVLFTDHRSLVYLDQRNFDNKKISRWQEKLTDYKFTVEYLPGEQNIMADMLSRPSGVKYCRKPPDPTPAGKFLEIGKGKLLVYIPSWCTDLTVDKKRLAKSNNEDRHVNSEVARILFNAEVTLQKYSTSTELENEISAGLSQAKDPVLSKIIRCLEERGKKRIKDVLDASDERHRFFIKNEKDLYLQSGAGVLMIDIKGTPKMVVPPHLRAFYLRQAHDEMGHGGRDRVLEYIN